jgi:DNA-directed RNA polymerase subunit B
LPIDSSILCAPHGILIFTDMGTVQFPAIDIRRLNHLQHTIGNSTTLFPYLLSIGVIEYIEPWEALDYHIIFKPSDIEASCTHLAIHPMAFLGTSASSVPWSDHDQAPRVSYQAGMLKQSVSTPASNLLHRYDMNCAFSLWYPQTPMADTCVSKSRDVHDWPMGENLLIAIGSYEGLSQEDAIVRNKAAIERGSGRVSVYKMFKAVLHKLTSCDYETFESPLDSRIMPCIGIRAECDYSKIDSFGLPFEGTYVHNNDILIGRVLYTTDDSGKRVRRERSILLTCEETESYIVDKVLITTNGEGLRQVRVRLRTMRIPQVGDKISDRHGQKGVIGFLASPEDLPLWQKAPMPGFLPMPSSICTP